ncbi:transglycosylase SLT domain-containing protein [Helicobacter sp. 23-1046]
MKTYNLYKKNPLKSAFALAFTFTLSVSCIFSNARGGDYYAFMSDDNMKVLQSFGLEYDFLPEQSEYKDRIETKSDYFFKKFENSYLFIPTIRSIIAQEGLPQEFLFVAMIESEFALNAKSPKKASGIWQFMPGTARFMGLEVNKNIDERYDVIKSTRAALSYLKYLYELTGEWYLAVMAYNCGNGRVKRAIEEAGGDMRLSTLLDDEKAYLPAETRNYIRKIVAMSLTFNDADFLRNSDMEYLLNRGATDSLAVVKLRSGTSLDAVARSAGISLKELKKYNLHFKKNIIPQGRDKEYNVYLPYENLARFHKNFKGYKGAPTDKNTQSATKVASAQKPSSPSVESVHIIHRVKKGETLSSISRKYNTNINEIKRVNGLKDASININQKLVVPTKG